MSKVFSFPGIKDGRAEERTVAVVHKHWWALVREVVGVALLFVAPLIALPVLATFFATSADAAQMGALFGFLGASWALISWHILFTRWTDYYFDMWIITNWRVVDIELKGLFRLDIATILDLDHIQDIKTESVGVIANVLNFGRVVIQTAGTSREFEFRDCPAPRKVERIIRDSQEELVAIKRSRGEL